MQYRTKPAPRTVPNREVRTVTNVPSSPELMPPARESATSSTTISRRYSAVMALGLTWAERSSSFISAFSCRLSISRAIIDRFLRLKKSR